MQETLTVITCKNIRVPKCRTGDSQVVKAETKQSDKWLDADDNRGVHKFLKVQDIQMDGNFVLNRRLVLNVKVVETRTSLDSSDLKAPEISLKQIVGSLGEASSKSPDVRVVLSNGEMNVLGNLLASRSSCKLLKAAIKDKNLLPIKVEEEDTHLGANSKAGATKKWKVSGPVGGDIPPTESTAGSEKPSHVLQLPNFPVSVFKALVGWLQTACINFGPLHPEIGSRMPDSLAVNSIFAADESCSPKLLYAFAIGNKISDLAEACKAAYAALLLPSIALLELADRVTRGHPPLVEIVEQYALEHWSEISTLPRFGEHLKPVMKWDKSREALTRILQNLPKA
ncbi:hypothetical protein P389DRAFT_190383 [Cystobasidium minutum MCA 4210]|uniref:uncharacterized protein n=1 Tax=Cystobasidium minutum MCA 4210 TaxID=1397322 RepID=UPI0034CDAEDC|eukprot:jgi/Rhomi1/190383/estExt_fgenesh1_pg.C_5_t10166